MSEQSGNPGQLESARAVLAIWDEAKKRGTPHRREAEKVAEALRELVTNAYTLPQPEIYIVQNDSGEVVGVFRDADEASAAYQYTHSGAEYSIIEETVSEPGEYADARIAELSAAWEESTGDRASDYSLSEDDWLVGLGDEEEAAEIVRLIEWREARA